MNDNSGNGVVVTSIGLILILLVIVGGAGVYYVIERKQAAMAVAAEMARAAEAQARMAAEQARAEAVAQAASQRMSRDPETPIVDANAIRTAVESVLRAQEEAWNQGDIDAFVSHYWKSDDLTFSSEGKTTRGWDETLKRYHNRYPTREQMGHLTLSGLEITPLGDAAALVLGGWNLQREDEPLSGNFSLVFRKFDDRWLIVHDHTSRIAE